MDGRNILVLLALLDAIYSRPSHVSHPYQDISVVLEGLDFDNDGIISSGELYQYYKSLDVNNDGMVTYEEFTKSNGPDENQQIFAYFDTLDGRRDNRISRRKIAGALQQLYDLNYDGSITASEIDVVRKRRLKDQQVSGYEHTLPVIPDSVHVLPLIEDTHLAQNLSGPNRRHSFYWPRFEVFRMAKILIFFCLFAYVYSQSTLSPQQEALLQSLQTVFNRVDANGDGRIVPDEELAYFDSLDLNKDGNIDYREFIASRVQVASGGPAPSQDILNATFTYYDTVAGKVSADGVLSRSDVRALFQLLDLDGNGEASLVEFDTAFIMVGEAIAALINAKTTPRS